MRAVLSILIALQAGPAAADEHLVPGVSVFANGGAADGYYRLVATAFAPLLQRNVAVRMIAMPAFHPEYAVGIAYFEDGTERIVALDPAQMLGVYTQLELMRNGSIKVSKDGGFTFEKDEQGIAELEAKMPKDPRDLKIARCERPIDGALVKRIRAAWESVVYRTRYDAPVYQGDVEIVTLTADADHYHFSLGDGIGGETADPSPESAPGRLLALAEALRVQCRDGSAASLAGLEAALKAAE
ncbi:MAG TPA: hypothetical protein VG889_17400 [Rhizomicrobium sp.]|nr:hypothetical protein [Rhizomicrobium sp.]